VRLCERVEDCIGQVVECHDGSERRLEAVSDKFIEYSVQIAPGTWMRLSPTRRGAVEKDFVGAPIVEGVTPESKSLPQIAAEEGVKVLESNNAHLAVCVARWRDAFVEFGAHSPSCRDFNNCDCGFAELQAMAVGPDVFKLPSVTGL
jgi:hypothetical protein